MKPYPPHVHWDNSGNAARWHAAFAQAQHLRQEHGWSLRRISERTGIRYGLLKDRYRDLLEGRRITEQS